MPSTEPVKKISALFQKIYAQLGRHFSTSAVGCSHLFHLSVNKLKPYVIKKKNNNLVFMFLPFELKKNWVHTLQEDL